MMNECQRLAAVRAEKALGILHVLRTMDALYASAKRWQPAWPTGKTVKKISKRIAALPRRSRARDASSSEPAARLEAQRVRPQAAATSSR